MAAIDKRFQIAPRPAAEVENRKWEIALDMPQQRLDVLADVVIARAPPEAFGGSVVMIQGPPGGRVEVVGVELLPGHGEPRRAFHPIQSQTARPMTSSRSRPRSHGSSSVKSVTHWRHEH